MNATNLKDLQVSTPSDREITITRSFDAPARLVFDAWTKPELVKRWLNGPAGWSMNVCEIDLRVGGTYRFVLSNVDGREMGWGGVYREIDAPVRFVNTELFDDSWYPGEAVITNELIEENGRTTLVTTMLLESKEGRDEVLKSGMESGMADSFAQLDEVLLSITDNASI